LVLEFEDLNCGPHFFQPPPGDARVSLKKEQTNSLSTFEDLETDTGHYPRAKKSLTDIDRKLPLGEHIEFHFREKLCSAFSMI